jgi:hypothetical protein
MIKRCQTNGQTRVAVSGTVQLHNFFRLDAQIATKPFLCFDQ